MKNKFTQSFINFLNRNENRINKLLGILVIFSGLISIAHGILQLANLNLTTLDNIQFDLNFAIREELAFLLTISGFLLFDGSKLSYRINLGLLVIFISLGKWLGIYQTGYYLFGGIIILLILFRNNFTNRLYLPYGIVLVVAFLIFAILYGVTGCYILREEFSGIKNITDALYFTVVTYSTVGYGDITPTSVNARLFVISMIIIGLILFTSSITLIAYGINNKLKNILFNINKGRISMKNHVVIIGYSPLARILIKQYHKDGKPFIIVDSVKDLDGERQILMEKNLLIVSAHMGDQDILDKIRADEASLIIICFESDPDNIFSTLNIREYLESKNSNVKIVVRILYEDNIKKARKAGADEVIAPHVLAAQAILGLNNL